MIIYDKIIQKLVHEGKEVKVIAQELGVTKKKVYDTLSEQIFPDYGVNSQAQLIRKILMKAA